MASLLDRLSAPEGTVGPVRSKPNSRLSSPYLRPNRPPKGDPDSQWSHDLFEDPDKPSLSSRLTNNAAQPRKADSLLARRALREVTGVGPQLSIKGASGSSGGNVVQVEGLVKGTTPADVEAIFKRCGAILSSALAPGPAADGVAVRLTFKDPAAAAAAVEKFDKQQADGRTLRVRIAGNTTSTLVGRLGGVEIARESGSVDVLMASGGDQGGKLRSDSIAASDPRATVLVAPPGADPKLYSQQSSANSRQEAQRWQRGGGRGGRGRRGGNRRGGGGGGGGGGMDVD
ncbi:hypothetical protein BV22DRAFT_1007938 [Leucogyrophana mollusca]|uniref:Uncharacterized protein n=1 Tax=Leucogyrophana mollusca TaxID=85980 RepID=A0ACB8BQ04_9AGAM|nr:hypothetical protein BV22DRAFT_1007938 [Leucogyrophana mollusca]